jgi:hypothetical protein
MTNQTESPQENPSNWDPFPEPSTIPTGWDLSEYLDKPVDFLVSLFDQHKRSAMKRDATGQ